MAKFGISVSVSDNTPAVGQPVTVVVRSDVDLEYDLELIAVAPGKDLYDVVGRVTGDSSLARATIPPDGHWVPLQRVATNRWRATIRFPRPGSWRLVVPNGAPQGFMIPPPAVTELLVHARSAPDATSRRCPVTVPTETVPPDAGFGPAAFNYGNKQLRAHLSWPRGTLTAGTLPDGGAMATVNRNGSIRLKIGWWRGLRHMLMISGYRLDAPAPPLAADIPNGYGATGFQPVALIFPSVGCWRVDGRLGPARLSFVVRVTKIR